MPRDRKAILRDIFDWGELERDAAMFAQYHVHGGTMWRFWKWMERKCRENRLDCINERDTGE